MGEDYKFEHFEVLKRTDGGPLELGRGAMGITYKAFDTSLQCPVALKVISGNYLQSEIAKQRFLREARAAAALRHPNVASVYHLGSSGETYFYAMEFIDGETVEQLMKREGAVSPPLALEIALQVSRALGAAHKQGLVHRDIKPANLMLVRDEAGDLLVKVIDFGLAKSAESGGDDPTITMGGFLGTPHFASPEQLEEKQLDIRSDIYSLGVTLWYMLSGKTPFSGSLAQVMSQHLNAPPPLESLSWLPAPIVALLGRMMAKNPDARPQNPHELRKDIEACIDELGKETPSQSPPPLPAASDAEAGATFAFDEAPAPSDGQEFETAADVSLIPPGTVADFSPGGIVGARYKITGPAEATDRGMLFPAEVIEGGAKVALLVLAAEQLATSEAVTAMEELAAKLHGANAASLRKILSFETVSHTPFLVLEAAEGPTLLDLLRSRRVLPLAEAIQILRPIAEAVDTLAGKGLECPELLPHDIQLCGQPPTPKFLPLPVSGGAVFDPGATIVATSMGSLRSMGAFGSDPSREAVYSLASLAYEILGGVRSGSGTVVPIAGLSENGNAAVRKALDPRAAGYASASAFIDEIGEDAPAFAQAAAPAPIPQQAPQTPASPQQPPLPPPQPIAPPPLPRDEEKGGYGALAGAIAVLLLVIAGLGIGAWFIFSHRNAPANSQSLAETASTPEPPTSAPTPPPATDPVEEILAAANSAGSPQTALPAIASGLAKFPSDPSLQKAAATQLAGLVSAQPSPETLSSIEDAIVAAAPHADPATITSLAERFIPPGTDLKNLPLKPKEAQRALLAIAAEKGDANATFLLGECYFLGTVPPPDTQKGVDLYRQAAAKGEPRALNKLGNLVRRGEPQGIVQQDPDEAFRLFGEAAAKGFGDAQGNLGVMLLQGYGSTPANPAKALEIFTDGARKGYASCLFFYGACLEDGIGGLAADPKTAALFYAAAARAGYPPAAQWCRTNSVDPSSQPPPPDLP